MPDSDACIDAIVGKCKKANYVGDGYCDDGNNNAGCTWDGGDCCGVENNYDFCTDCDCLNCTFPVLSDNCTDNIQKSCGAKLYQGDGFCDDANNVAGCAWDLGDCCDPAADKSFCTDCECLDCTYEFDSDDCVDIIVGVCGAAKYAGDGYCKYSLLVELMAYACFGITSVYPHVHIHIGLGRCNVVKYYYR